MRPFSVPCQEQQKQLEFRLDRSAKTTLLECPSCPAFLLAHLVASEKGFSSGSVLDDPLDLDGAVCSQVLSDVAN